MGDSIHGIGDEVWLTGDLGERAWNTDKNVLGLAVLHSVVLVSWTSATVIYIIAMTSYRLCAAKRRLVVAAWSRNWLGCNCLWQKKGKAVFAVQNETSD